MLEQAPDDLIRQPRRHAIEDAHAPDHRGDHVGDGRRDEEHRAEEALAERSALNQDSQEQGQCKCGRHDEDGKHHHRAERLQKLGVSQHRLVICEADELG